MGGRGGSEPVPDVPCSSPTGLPVMSTAPALLSETGLYSDITSDAIDSEMRAFTPQFELWSDGATKRRWIYLPDCEIGTTDMDDWVFPVGTRAFKEFTVGATRIETRLIHRTGPGPDDFWYATYLWQDDGLDAQLVRDGVPDAKGTTFDVPSGDACFACHQAAPWRLLGFGAIQLSHQNGGTTLASLTAEGLLSTPGETLYTVPNEGGAAPALGYLHVNCGNCHHPGFKTFAFFSTRLEVAQTTAGETFAYTEGILGTIHGNYGVGVTDIIVPGDPAASAMSARMASRIPEMQMPPLGTEDVDAAGLAIIDAWIAGLPAQN